MNPKVEIYTIPTCSDCNDAKRFFKENEIEYTEYDCTKDQAYADKVRRLTGKQIVPTIKIGNQVFVGFSENYDEIRKLLQ